MGRDLAQVSQAQDVGVPTGVSLPSFTTKGRDKPLEDITSQIMEYKDDRDGTYGGGYGCDYRPPYVGQYGGYGRDYRPAYIGDYGYGSRAARQYVYDEPGRQS